MTFWSSTLRLRMRPHRCETCGQRVRRGEESYDEAGLYDGEFSSFRQCRACHDIVSYFYWRGTLDGREGYMLCELADCAHEEGLLWPPVWNWTVTDLPDLATAARAGLADIDKAISECPAMRRHLGKQPCPKCNAASNEGCRERVAAESRLVQSIREAIA